MALRWRDALNETRLRRKPDIVPSAAYSWTMHVTPCTHEDLVTCHAPGRGMRQKTPGEGYDKKEEWLPFKTSIVVFKLRSTFVVRRFRRMRSVWVAWIIFHSFTSTERAISIWKLFYDERWYYFMLACHSCHIFHYPYNHAQLAI